MREREREREREYNVQAWTVEAGKNALPKYATYWIRKSNRHGGRELDDNMP